MWESKFGAQNKTNVAQKLEEINEQIRLGLGSDAKKKLLLLNNKKLSNTLERIRYSNLARRLSLPQEALRVLHPFVRPPDNRMVKATEEECIEYAASLIKIGANTEALNILKSLHADLLPQVCLFTAFAYIGIWEYEEAIPWLKKYIESNKTSQYEKLVAKANLCEALGFLKHPDTQSIINETLTEAKINNYNLIYAHLQMTRSIYAIENKKWGSASNALETAEKYFEAETFESFFIRKWRTIMYFYKDKKHDRKGLNSIRKEAIEKWSHWETARDCDFYEAVITENEQLFNHLYFGTPYPSFRKRLLNYWNRKAVNPEIYEWVLNKNSKPEKTIELFSGSSCERVKLLNTRKQCAALLGILCTDFYRPASTAFLFAKLYPGEYFNPKASPVKLRTAIYNVRKWLTKEKLPLLLIENSGAYKLSSTVNVKMCIPKNLSESYLQEIVHKTDLLQSILLKKESFTAEDASTALKLPRRTVNRLLTQAVEKGLLVRNGSSSKTNYAWTKSIKRFTGS